jgi:HEAT repeat protein
MLFWKVRGLKSKNKLIRRRTVKELGESHNKRAVGPLLAALNDEDIEVQIEAVLALGQIGDPSAVEPLIEKLEDCKGYEMKKMENAIARALGQIGDKRAVDPLIARLALTAGRETIAQALGAIGDKRAVEPLIRQVAVWGSLEAAKSLDRIEPAWTRSQTVRDAIPSLIDRLERKRGKEELILNLIDPNWRESEAAQKAIKKLIATLGSELTTQEKYLLSRQEIIIDKIAKIDPNWRASQATKSAIVNQLVANLTHHANKQEALDQLTKIDPNWRALQATKSAVVDHLVANLAQQDSAERAATQEILTQIDPSWKVSQEVPKPTLSQLIEELKSINLELQMAAVRELSQVYPDWQESEAAKNAVPSMIHSLNHGGHNEGTAAARALGYIADARAIEPLAAQIHHSGFGRGEAAIQALIQIRDPNAINALVNAILQRPRGGEYMGKSILKALRSIGWQPANQTEEAYQAIVKNQWSELLKLGSAAVKPLVQAITVGHNETVRVSYSKVLLDILKKDLEDVTSDDLRAVSSIADETKSVGRWAIINEADEREYVEEKRVVTVDYSPLRQLAQQELRRRNISTST